jgi:hypothetical protein
MKKSLMVGAILALAGSSLPVLAQPPGGGPGGRFQPPTFADLDENEDGKIVQEEFDTWMQERMDAMGRGPGGGAGGPPGGFGGPSGGPGGPPGGFGGPSGGPGGPPAGFGGPGGGPGGMFTSWDANGDGAVTEEEFNARPRFRGGYGAPGGGGPAQ